MIKLLVLCLAVCSTLADSREKLLRNAEMDLLQLMIDTRQEQRNNPEQSMACFDYYLALFERLNEEYKASHEACLTTAAADREDVDEGTNPQRAEIEEAAQSSCEEMKTCAKYTDSVDYFGCFSKSGKESSESSYKISADASEILAAVRESYRVIENEENRCTNASARTYVEETYQANEALQSCLRGETTVPPATESPTTAIPDSNDSAIKSMNVPVEKFRPDEAYANNFNTFDDAKVNKDRKAAII
ncbi:unnamed protein product [Ceratitis capitata]|uniref:(Mediterranean fruit fly) hypothetical protein n=1 Tax=Ceratitis capitata TaxID=7213 RepID=W8C3U0_CERCA|nr:unnamed protein product [Ceratitis capitata]